MADVRGRNSPVLVNGGPRRASLPLRTRQAWGGRRWLHWDASVTPLHLTAFGDRVESARLLLAAGADPRIRDSKHDSDAIGWAEHFGRVELRRVLEAGAATS